MESTIQQTISNVHTSVAARPSFVSQFMKWCTNQDQNRYGWLGAAVASHACIITPFTMFAIILSGNNIIFWFLTIAAMMMTLVTNLAALPTKITIPVFLFSVVLDVVIISACAVAGFNIAGTYI